MNTTTPTPEQAANDMAQEMAERLYGTHWVRPEHLEILSAQLLPLMWEVQEARKDKERLDWMEARGEHFGCLIEVIKDKFGGWKIGCAEDEHVSLRAALDAAAAQAGKERV